MNTSSLKEKMVQAYREQLRVFLSSIWYGDIPDEALSELDQMIAIVKEERDLLVVHDGLTMELSWLNSTAHLVGHLLDFHTIPYTRKVAQETTEGMPEEFDEVYKRIVYIIVRQSRVADALRKLSVLKRIRIEDLLRETLRIENDQVYSTMKEWMLDRLDSQRAKILGTDVETLVRKRQELCEFFPELNLEDTGRMFVGARLNLLVERSPSEMDDFTGKIVQVVSEILSDSSTEELTSKTREEIMTALMTARKESFSGTTESVH